MPFENPFKPPDQLTHRVPEEHACGAEAHRDEATARAEAERAQKQKSAALRRPARRDSKKKG
jgi:hypothetical protein